MNFKHKVSVLVEPTYLEDHSDPTENSYLWAYTVKIRNEGNDTVKLISRHWSSTSIGPPGELAMYSRPM